MLVLFDVLKDVLCLVSQLNEDDIVGVESIKVVLESKRNLETEISCDKRSVKKKTVLFHNLSLKVVLSLSWVGTSSRTSAFAAKARSVGGNAR